MAVNMFEGARRVMKLTMVLIGITGIVIAYNSKPDINLVYEIPFIGEMPLRIISEKCNSYEDAEETSYYEVTSEGVYYDQILCFKAHRSDNGEMVIPYKIDPTGESWFGGSKYEKVVIEYIRLVKSNFAVTAIDEQYINKQYWPKKIMAIAETLGITAFSIFSFWIFCWVMGWIIRGFASISMGQDLKK